MNVSPEVKITRWYDKMIGKKALYADSEIFKKNMVELYYAIKNKEWEKAKKYINILKWNGFNIE